MKTITSLLKKEILNYYDPSCQDCQKSIIKLRRIKIGRIELIADYNSAGHLTHYHIKVYQKRRKRGENI